MPVPPNGSENLNSDSSENVTNSSRNSTTTNPDPSSQYEELIEIGSGAYGTVFKARDMHNNGKMVALKKIRVPLTENGVPVSILREITVLRQLQNFDHSNVVKLLDICHGRSNLHERQFTLFLVFEHVDQDLSTYMERCPGPGLSLEKIRDILFQILTGVDFLHSNRIVHRDLKPANILISNQGKVKLADFGLARIYEHAQLLTALVVTLWYRAPEVLLQANYASPIDIWSCGCIFAELYSRKPLFSGQSENEQLCRIFDMIGAPDAGDWPKEISIPCSNFSNFRKRNLRDVIQDVCPAGKELFEKMLIFSPLQRISAKHALEHEYFADFQPSQSSS